MNSTTHGDIRIAVFAPCVGDTFVAYFSEEGCYSLVLTEVKEHVRGRRSEGFRDSFSLFFSGPGPRYLMQGTYKLNHERLGDLEIFVVPVGETDEGFRYQVVFN